MFKNNNEKQVKNSADAVNSNNIIGKGSTFTGNVETYGNIRVEGKILGDLKSKSKSFLETRRTPLSIEFVRS